MAHYPIAEPDPDGFDVEPSATNRSGEVFSRGPKPEPQHLEQELIELTTKFSSDEGGQLSAELSANLALEVILNEIVQRACITADASGAAVILERDGEWVCRASSGTGVPELDARLSGDSGLTAECIKTRRVQRCDDTEKDSRVDIEACRRLGVRSLIMLPILQAGKLIGVFAAFSPRVSAFGEEQERDLRLLSSDVIRSLELTSEPPPSIEEKTEKMPAPERTGVKQIGAQTPAVGNPAIENKLQEKVIAIEPRDRLGPLPENVPVEERKEFKIATWVLTGVVLLFAVFLTVVASQRFFGGKTTRRNVPGQSQPQGDLASQSNENRDNENQGAAASGRTGDRPSENATAGNSAIEAGSLTVYENGKEVFHLPAATEKHDSNGAVASGESVADKSVSAAQAPRIYELSPEEAQRELLLRVEPVYPEQAREQGVEGIVVMRVRARRDGRVRDVKLVGGQPLLVEAAMAAVKQWQFKPHLVNGQPVETQTRITLVFETPR